MVNRSNRSGGESNGDHAPRTGPSSAPPSVGWWNHIPSHQASAGRCQSSRWRPDLMLPSSTLEAPPPSMSGLPSSGLRPGSGWSCKRLGTRASQSRRRSPGEALVTPRALLRHPPVRAGSKMPERKLLDDLASLVGKASLRLRAQGSRTIFGDPFRGGLPATVTAVHSGLMAHQRVARLTLPPRREES
jgi:hypothetical protein